MKTEVKEASRAQYELWSELAEVNRDSKCSEVAALFEKAMASESIEDFDFAWKASERIIPKSEPV